MDEKLIRTTYQVTFTPAGVTVAVPPDDSIMNAAEKAGIGLAILCQGRGTCGKCRVRRRRGDLTPPTAGEGEFLTGEELKHGWRLACQAYPRSDCRIDIRPETLSASPGPAWQDQLPPVKPDPVLRRYPLALSPPTTEDNQADASRLLMGMAKQHRGRFFLDAALLPGVADTLRQADWQVQVLVRGREILEIRPMSQPGPRLGLAVDLGTTTIAAYLVDLDDGQTRAVASVANPQSCCGVDIISRLERAAASAADAGKMQKLAVAALNELSDRLCAEAGAVREDIAEAVVAGNTAMHHLLLGLPVESLGRAPFTAAVTQALEIKAQEVGLAIMPGGYLRLLPNIGGFIGGDLVAALLDTPLRPGPALLIDIGTNTEIALITDTGITAVSCASGPALEGAQISHGMAARAGAIEHLDFYNSRPRYRTIGGSPPRGLCGSAVVDAVAALRRAGVLDKSGRMQPHPGVQGQGKTREFVLVEARKGQPAITFTQSDVRQVQLAKAAIRTGIKILLQGSGYTENDLRRVLLAGAFGAGLDWQNSIAIGLLPDLPLDRFHAIGNAAAAGARRVLLSRTCRRRADLLALRVRHLELAAQPDFDARFLAALALP